MLVHKLHPTLRILRIFLLPGLAEPLPHQFRINVQLGRFREARDAALWQEDYA